MPSVQAPEYIGFGSILGLTADNIPKAYINTCIDPNVKMK